MISSDDDWWVLLVTDGCTVEYPPEVYVDERLAESEAERWSRLLATDGQARIERPFPGRWEIGDHWVRLIPVRTEEGMEEMWVGTYWTWHGFPEPEAELFASAEAAREWALTPPPGGLVVEVLQNPWMVGASYRVRDGQEEAVAHRAKVIG
jgi:hypothetical protein